MFLVETFTDLGLQTPADNMAPKIISHEMETAPGPRAAGILYLSTLPLDYGTLISKLNMKMVL